MTTAPVRRRPHSRVTDAEKLKFLQALCGEFGFENMTVGAACRLSGIDRRYAYELKEKDTEFGEAWDMAYASGTDLMEDEAARRAFKGYIKPVFQQGHRVGSIREYSDKLAELMLRKRNPAFKDRTELSGEVTTKVVTLSSDESEV